MAEKVITYVVKLIVRNHNTAHIKKFENALMKMVNGNGFNGTEYTSVKEVKK